MSNQVRRLSSDADDDVTTGEEQEPGVKRPRKRLGRPPKKDSLQKRLKQRAIDGLLKKKKSVTVKELLEQKKAQKLHRLTEASPQPQPTTTPTLVEAQTAVHGTLGTSEGVWGLCVYRHRAWRGVLVILLVRVVVVQCLPGILSCCCNGRW